MCGWWKYGWSLRRLAYIFPVITTNALCVCARSWVCMRAFSEFEYFDYAWIWFYYSTCKTTTDVNCIKTRESKKPNETYTAISLHYDQYSQTRLHAHTVTQNSTLLELGKIAERYTSGSITLVSKRLDGKTKTERSINDVCIQRYRSEAVIQTECIAARLRITLVEICANKKKRT